MSLPVYQDFSGPVMSVPTVGNPTTPKESIAATRTSNAGPVANKSALISRQLTLEPRKPHNVAPVVIGTFSETLVSKCISARTTLAKRTHSPPCAFIAVAVLTVLNRTLDYKRLQGTNASTWTARLAMSTCTEKPIFVLFKDPQSLKTRRERGNVKEVLAPNEEQLRSLKPHRRRRTTTCHPCTCFLILKPCNPTNNTLLISSWPKPKTTINLFVSQANIVPEIFSNGWIHSR